MALLSKVDIGDTGLWLVYYTDPDDETDQMKICVGSSSSPSYKSRQRKLAARFAKKGTQTGFANSDFSPEETRVMLVELGAELTHGWSGFQMTQRHFNIVMGLPEGDDDTVITVPHTRENAVAILGYPGFQHMLDFVTINGADAANHVKKKTEEDVGNSQAASSSS